MTAAAELRVTRDAGRLTVHVRGELDFAYEDQLVTVVTEALDEDRSAPLILDLTGLQFIDSSGLRAVLRCQQLAQAQLRLRVVQGPVTRLFDIAGVTHRFEYV